MIVPPNYTIIEIGLDRGSSYHPFKRYIKIKLVDPVINESPIKIYDNDSKEFEQKYNYYYALFASK
jgi:hypothetical protein